QRPILLETEAERKSVFSLQLSFLQEKKKVELLKADIQSVTLLGANSFLAYNHYYRDLNLQDEGGLDFGNLFLTLYLSSLAKDIPPFFNFYRSAMVSKM
ncbi:MAG: hypothetical protein MJZ70_08255, partial [Bacteroidales bacterium]|nr:hypothetical protein [Bacteroidales bacterium]